MKRVSRDANITQFFGVCQQAETMLLVQEYMEASCGAGSISWPCITCACKLVMKSFYAASLSL